MNGKTTIAVTIRTKSALEKRKVIKQHKTGRSISIDEVLQDMLFPRRKS